MATTTVRINENFLLEILHLKDVVMRDAAFIINDQGIAHLHLTIEGSSIPEGQDRSDAIFERKPESITVRYEPTDF